MNKALKQSSLESYDLIFIYKKKSNSAPATAPTAVIARNEISSSG